MRLQGRKTFITGAAKGIGLSVAQAFAAEGAAVALADISGAENREQSLDISERFGVNAIGVECDVADSKSVENAIATAAKTFDGVDTIACMAATLTQRLDVVDLPEEDWDNTLRVNLTGSFLVCKHGIPLLRKAGGGSIILTASQMGQVAWPGSTAYCTTKAVYCNW